jgi:hypothetical protein
MKAHYVLAAAAAATTVMALAAASTPLPPSWSVTGKNPEKYQAGVDTSASGRNAKFLRSTTSDPEAWAALYQVVQAQRYLGQRVRFRARVRTQYISNWAGLWMRVDPKGGGEGNSLAFYNSQDKPIKGTADWQERSVVLDVPPDAHAIVFGVIGEGTGQVWMEPLAFETVGRDVPVDALAQPPLPTTPTL